MDRNKLLEEGKRYPVKIEYYKTLATKENVENKYGIEIVKTEYINGKANIESNRISNITNDLDEANKLLKILRDNEVTPISMQYILDDLALIV